MVTIAMKLSGNERTKMKLRGMECALLKDLDIVKLKHGEDWFEISGRELRAGPALGSTKFNAETMTVEVLDGDEWKQINDWAYDQIKAAE